MANCAAGERGRSAAEGFGVAERRKKKLAGDLAAFIRSYRRKAPRGGEPNDRGYDRELEAKLKRMSPEELDSLMRDEVEDDSTGGRLEPEPHLVLLTVAELVLLSNALNEVLHGVGIEEPEFSTRLGASRAEAEQLLARIGSLVDTPDA